MSYPPASLYLLLMSGFGESKAMLAHASDVIKVEISTFSEVDCDLFRLPVAVLELPECGQKELNERCSESDAEEADGGWKM